MRADMHAGKGREAGRQAGRQADKQPSMHTDMQACRRDSRQASRQASKQANMHEGRQAGREACGCLCVGFFRRKCERINGNNDIPVILGTPKSPVTLGLAI